MRLFAAAVVGLAVALPVVTASSSAAYAANYLDEAVQALQTQHIYVSPLAQASIDTKSKASLEQQTNGTNIGVVVLPASAKAEAGDIPQFLTDLSAQSGKETVVVAFGNDLEASSHTVSNASKLANDAEHAHATNTGEALVSFVTEAQHVSAAPAAADGPGVIGIGVFVLVGAAAAATVVTAIRRKRRKAENPILQYRNSLRIPGDTEQASETTPEEIRSLLGMLTTYDIHDTEVVATIRRSIVDTKRLFKQLAENNLDRITLTEITTACELQLKKVSSILKTYVDAQAYPDDYEDAPAIIREGKAAVGTYLEGIRDNIRQAKSGAVVEFNVNVSMLSNANRRQDPNNPLDLGKRKK